MEMIWEISSLLNFEVLGVFVNTLTADENYPFGESGDLQSPIEMQLYWKQKTFSEFFVPFMESPWNFKNFHKKGNRHSERISEIADCQRLP